MSPHPATRCSRRQVIAGGMKLLAGAALLPAGAELLAACGSSSTKASTAATMGDLGTMTFQFDWITNVQFAGSYIAQTDGYYRAAGIGVNLVTGGPSVSVAPVVAAGKALCGVTDPVSASAANAMGADLVIVGAKFQRSPNCIISLASDPITTPQQLVGKKVGIGASSISIMQAFMKANNLDYNSLHVVPIQFDPAPLAQGEVQGYFGYISNEAITLELEGHPVHTMLLADFGLAQYAENYGVQRSALADPQKRDQIKAFLHAEIRGWQDVVANPQPAVDLVVSRYGTALGLDPKEQSLEATAQNQLITDATTQAHGLFWMSDEAIQANLKSLSLTGISAQPSLFDNSLLAEVYGGSHHLTS